MACRVLQLSRAVIDGGFDYHREISLAFRGGGFDVTNVFQRGTLSAAEAGGYCGRTFFLDARRRRLYKKSWVVALWLLALSRGRGFDLVICHHYAPAVIASLLARLTRRPRMFFVVHDHGYFDPGDPRGRRRNRFVMRTLDPHCRLVAVSHAIRRNILEAMPGLDPERCLVIHNAIDMKRLAQTRVGPAEARRELGLDPGAFVFGNVGRLVPYKAQRELIDAFARAYPQMPGSQLVIIGRGPLKRELASRIARHGLQGAVKLLDFVPHAARLMPAFDCFVLPSRNEPFGLVLLEAMANRLPVIADDSGAAPEILPYAEGLADTGDVADFAGRLLAFFRAPAAFRRRLGDLGHDHARQAFSLERYRACYRALWPGEPAAMVSGDRAL